MLAEMEPEARRAAQAKLSAMYEYCNAARCRHAALLEYFGQRLERPSCGSCDICLGLLEPVPDALVLGQKILSSVVRQGEDFGPLHTALTLTGSREQRIVDAGHEALTTHGLLKDRKRESVLEWIGQLMAQQYIEQPAGPESLKVTDKGRRVLRGEVTPRLLRPLTAREAAGKGRARKPREDEPQWTEIERDLMDMLKVLRRGLADAREVPAFLIFSDATLREMARRRPSSPDSLRQVSGVGQRKAADFGKDFLSLIRDFCKARNVEMDQA
jgi:ATP-dependent DNA helicase RecQ